LPCLVEAVDHSAVDDGRKTGEAGRDENDDAVRTPLAALEPWVEDEDGGKGTKDEDLRPLSTKTANKVGLSQFTIDQYNFCRAGSQ
jgi:hypothetical protein